MASADYRLCDVCDNKAFYDASLNYETAAPDWAPDRAPARYAGNSMGSAALWIDHLGDWAVLCSECAKTHRAVILGPDEVLLTRNQLRDWLAYLQGGRIGPVTVEIEEALR